MTVAVSNVGRHLGVNRVVRHVAILVAASVVSGILVGGVGGRIVMRISANAAGLEMAGRLTENGNTIGRFTLGGTALLIVFGGAFAGLAGGALIVGSDLWLRWMGPLRGLGFAVVTLAASTTFVSSDFVILDPPGLNVAMFLALHVAFGLTVVGVYRLLDHRLPVASEREQPGYVVGLALGGLSLVIELAAFTIPTFCGCDRFYAIAVAVLVMLASSGIRLASSVIEDVPVWLTRGATITGYGSLASLLALGLGRNVDRIQLIL